MCRVFAEKDIEFAVGASPLQPVPPRAGALAAAEDDSARSVLAEAAPLWGEGEHFDGGAT